MKPFVDANVIAKAFVDNPDKENCRKVLFGGFVTDALCLIEAQRAISRIKGSREHAADSILSLFRIGSVIVPVDKALLSYELKLYGKNSLDAADSLHYVSAMLHNCSEIISYDKDFDNLSIKRTQP